MTNEQKETITKNMDYVLTAMYNDFMYLMDRADAIGDEVGTTGESAIVLDFTRNAFRECYKQACRKKLEIIK